MERAIQSGRHARYDEGQTYLAGVGEAAVEVVLVGPVLEVADPQRADLLQARRLVVRRRHRAGRRRGTTSVGGGAVEVRRGRVKSGLVRLRPLSFVLVISLVSLFLCREFLDDEK